MVAHGAAAFCWRARLVATGCERHCERSIGNCVSFEGLSLQIPADEFRYHYVRTRVRMHRYVDATMALFHGPCKLAA